jgi:hypothetical protein
VFYFNAFSARIQVPQKFPFEQKMQCAKQENYPPARAQLCKRMKSGLYFFDNFMANGCENKEKCSKIVEIK